MKKFLFTLAALLMVGSAYADDYLYIEDFSVTAEFLAQTAGKQRRVDVPVKAHFDTFVSAWMVWVDPPEGIEMKNAVEGADMTLNTLDAIGNDKAIPVALNVSLENHKFIAANAVAGYYYPEGADPDEDDPTPVGAAKWEPGVYESMFVITFQFAQDFTGGDIVVITEPSCSGTDPRGEVCPKNQHHEIICHVTVEGGEEPPVQTPAPVINVTPGDDSYIFEAVGEGEITLYLDGNPVENPYTVVRTDQDQTVKFTATAHVEGQIDGTVTSEFLVPALPVVEPEDLTGEIVIGEPDEDGNVEIGYNGDEEVTIVVTVNGEEVEVVDGVITVPEGESEIVVTVSAEGYNDLTDTKTVTYEPTVEPQPTEKPVITYEVTDDAVIITATGEGEVLLYVDGEPVDNPVTIVRGTEDKTVVVTATAQAEGGLISETATMEITIPAISEVPEDPHMTGCWVVCINENGEEEFYRMNTGDINDPEGVQTNVAMVYKIYGMPDGPYPNNWFNVNFYLLVDGVKYGPDTDNKEPVYGNANENPVYENENFWAVPVGFKYVIGIIYDEITDGWYMQISMGTFVGVDELNADKTVAGVRYFNMAGQEMQEANGMTIVVTTYTDGTTSAVKVIK